MESGAMTSPGFLTGDRIQWSEKIFFADFATFPFTRFFLEGTGGHCSLGYITNLETNEGPMFTRSSHAH